MSIDKVAQVVFIGGFFLVLLAYLASALMAFYFRQRSAYEICVMNRAHEIQKDRFDNKMDVVWR